MEIGIHFGPVTNGLRNSPTGSKDREVLATTLVIASTGAMLIVGHEAPCRLSALACRSESTSTLANSGNSRQVSGTSDASKTQLGLIGSCRRCRDFHPGNTPTISMSMHHEFISVGAPESVKCFLWRDTVAVMRCDCSANWYEIGNGNSCFGFQLVQSVRHHVVRLADTSETYKHSFVFGNCESIRFSSSDWGKGDIPTREFSIGGIHFDVLGSSAEENRNTVLATAKKTSPYGVNVQSCVP